jgi:hypothetical protein
MAENDKCTNCGSTNLEEEKFDFGSGLVPHIVCQDCGVAVPIKQEES